MSQEVIWGNESKHSLNTTQYEQVMKNYVEMHYPQEVQAFNKQLDMLQNADLYTVVYKNIMYQDDKAVTLKVRNHKDAKLYCKKLDLLGYTDWKLPDLFQLKTIVDKNSDETIKKEFKHSVQNGYWTSREVGEQAWIVSFLTGQEYKFKKTIRYYTRCVRDAK